MAGQSPFNRGGGPMASGAHPRPPQPHPHAHFRNVTAMDLGLDPSGYESVLDGSALHLHHESHQDHHPQSQPHPHPHHHHHQHHHPHHHQQQQQPPTPSPQQPPPHHPPPPNLHGGQFGILAPNPLPQEAQSALFRAHGQSLDASRPPQPAAVTALAAGDKQQPGGKPGPAPVVDPPDLAAWRAKLFDVNETIVLTNEQFETYFPHVDNVYSHRSTQRYKRKPFVSHYWDCRMKGRPPGTPKSDDPAKKKRKRNARERDLCDVKIKITEYSPGAHIHLDGREDGSGEGGAAAAAVSSSRSGGGGGTSSIMIVQPGEKFWTIQRVNGNGGNGKGDGVAGPHKHTLARSDEIKKNSVQRYLAQREKESRKSQKVAQRKASGAALATVKKHSKESDLKLYAACWCPFSQRVWIALEAKGVAYQYVETDPFRRPQSTALLEANPKGLVPALKQGEWACAESGVILEFLEDTDVRVPLMPSDPRLKANCRLWIDHINKNIVPAALSLLSPNLDPAARHPAAELVKAAITELVHAADEEGPFFLGSSLSLVDIHLAPLALRLVRGGGGNGTAEEADGSDAWAPVPGARWSKWLDALEGDASIAATVSSAELYVETVELVAGRTWPRR